MNRDLSVICIQEFQKIYQREQEEKATKNKQKNEASAARAVQRAKEAGLPPPELRPPGSSAGGLKVLDALSASGLRAFRYIQATTNSAAPIP